MTNNNYTWYDTEKGGNSYAVQPPLACSAGAVLLLAALFCVPSLVLTGSEWLPELTGAVENYVPFWKGLLRFLIFCAWCWVWLWTEGSALQILLALLLQFCGIWALCLLRPRPASRSHSHA